MKFKTNQNLFPLRNIKKRIKIFSWLGAADLRGQNYQILIFLETYCYLKYLVFRDTNNTSSSKMFKLLEKYFMLQLLWCNVTMLVFFFLVDYFGRCETWNDSRSPNMVQSEQGEVRFGYRKFTLCLTPSCQRSWIYGWCIFFFSGFNWTENVEGQWYWVDGFDFVSGFYSTPSCKFLFNEKLTIVVWSLTMSIIWLKYIPGCSPQ